MLPDTSFPDSLFSTLKYFADYIFVLSRIARREERIIFFSSRNLHWDGSGDILFNQH
jgi:hypothetical protein